MEEKNSYAPWSNLIYVPPLEGYAPHLQLHSVGGFEVALLNSTVQVLPFLVPVTV